VCLVTSLGGSGGKANCVGGADQVIFCEAGMQEELFIVDGLPSCRRSHNQWRDRSQSAPQCALFLLEDLNRLRVY